MAVSPLTYMQGTCGAHDRDPARKKKTHLWHSRWPRLEV